MTSTEPNTASPAARESPRSTKRRWACIWNWKEPRPGSTARRGNWDSRRTITSLPATRDCGWIGANGTGWERRIWCSQPRSDPVPGPGDLIATVAFERELSYHRPIPPRPWRSRPHMSSRLSGSGPPAVSNSGLLTEPESPKVHLLAPAPGERESRGRASHTLGRSGAQTPESRDLPLYLMLLPIHRGPPDPPA